MTQVLTTEFFGTNILCSTIIMNQFHYFIFNLLAIIALILSKVFAWLSVHSKIVSPETFLSLCRDLCFVLFNYITGCEIS